MTENKARSEALVQLLIIEPVKAGSVNDAINYVTMKLPVDRLLGIGEDAAKSVADDAPNQAVKQSIGKRVVNTLKQAGVEFFVNQPLISAAQGGATGLVTGGVKELSEGIKSSLADKGVYEEPAQTGKIVQEKLDTNVESPISKAIKAYTDLINLPKEIFSNLIQRKKRLTILLIE